MKKKIILGIIVISILIITISSSYSIYQNSVSASVLTTTGDIICELSVDTSDKYIENNEAYFIITINNFKTSDGELMITSSDIDYTLTIENTGTNQGLFRYIDDDGNTNTTPEESVSVERRIEKDKTTQQFKVFVTTDTNLKTDIDFKVKVNAVQADMG